MLFNAVATLLKQAVARAAQQQGSVRRTLSACMWTVLHLLHVNRSTIFLVVFACRYETDAFSLCCMGLHASKCIMPSCT